MHSELLFDPTSPSQRDPHAFLTIPDTTHSTDHLFFQSHSGSQPRPESSLPVSSPQGGPPRTKFYGSRPAELRDLSVGIEDDFEEALDTLGLSGGNGKDVESCVFFLVSLPLYLMFAL